MWAPGSAIDIARQRTADAWRAVGPRERGPGERAVRTGGARQLQPLWAPSSPAALARNLMTGLWRSPVLRTLLAVACALLVAGAAVAVSGDSPGSTRLLLGAGLGLVLLVLFAELALPALAGRLRSSGLVRVAPRVYVRSRAVLGRVRLPRLLRRLPLLPRLVLLAAALLLAASAAIATTGGAFSRPPNLAANSSFETDASSWVNSGTAIDTTSRTAKFGTSALAVRTNGKGRNEGAVLAGVSPGGFFAVKGSTDYSASVWARGAGSLVPILQWFDGSGRYLAGAPGERRALSGGWRRLELTARSPRRAGLARVFFAVPSPRATTFYLDGAQVEAASAPTAYHTSTVTRSTLLFWALLGAGLGLALLVLFAELALPALAIWAVLSVLAYPFLRRPVSDPILTFDRLWIGATVGCLIFAARASRTSRATQFLFAALVWLTVSYGLRAAATSADRQLALVYWLDALVLPLILFLVVRQAARARHGVELIAGALVAAGAVLALIGLGEVVFGFELATRSGGAAIYDAAIGRVRISGPYPAPEPYALSLLICLAATLLWMQLRRRYVLGAAIASLQGAAIGLTFFRMAWLALLVVVFVGLKLPRRRLLQLGAVLGVMVIAVFALSAVAGGNQFVVRLKNEKNVEGRIATYRQVFEVTRTSPLTGVGVNQYPTAVRQVSPVSVGGVPALPYPHNSFLGTLAEQGIAGLLALLAATGAAWYVVRSLRRAARSLEDRLLARAVRAGALAYLLMSLTLTMLPYGPSNAFFAVLLGLGASRLDGLSAEPSPEPVKREERAPAPRAGLAAGG